MTALALAPRSSPLPPPPPPDATPSPGDLAIALLTTPTVPANQPPLSRAAEEAILIARAQQGDQKAATELLRRYEAFVWKAVRRWLWSEVDLEDMAQEGRAGLLYAIQKFDLTLGGRLTTYADHWVRQHIQKFVQNTAGDIRIPQWRQNRGRTNLVFADRLDAPAGNFSSSTLRELIPCQDPPPESMVSDAQEARTLRGALDRLTERERVVIERVVMGDENGQDVATDLGISRERVRQLKEGALDKVRIALAKAGVRDAGG